MSDPEKFECWAVCEIMGHKKFAGLVSEQAIGGASFVRVDVPEVVGFDGKLLPAFSKLFGAASIYCLSPCTEETARAFAAQIRSQSFSLYEAPRLAAPETPLPPCDGVIPKPDTYEGDEDYNDEYDDIEYDDIDEMSAHELLASLETSPAAAVPGPVPGVTAWAPEVAAYPPPPLTD